EPAKRTSSGFSARSSPGLIEPVAHRIESETFDFPEPFGPTTTATPGSRWISTGSTNDLKPRSLIALRCTRGQATRRLGRCVLDELLEPADEDVGARSRRSDVPSRSPPPGAPIALAATPSAVWVADLANRSPRGPRARPAA